MLVQVSLHQVLKMGSVNRLNPAAFGEHLLHGLVRSLIANPAGRGELLGIDYSRLKAKRCEK